jgi:hypothetical protein
MATKPPRENMASTGEPGEVLATTQLQVRALGLTGALMQNITAIAPAITAFFFTATIVGFTGAISPFAYFLGFLSCWRWECAWSSWLSSSRRPAGTSPM